MSSIKQLRKEETREDFRKMWVFIGFWDDCIRQLGKELIMGMKERHKEKQGEISKLRRGFRKGETKWLNRDLIQIGNVR